MNQLIQMQSSNGKELLVYHYKKIQDVDEVILQLLNEAGLDGFIKSAVDRSTSTINYDVTGYKKWSAIAADAMTPDYMASVLEDLYRLLAYLEDSFIDIEYVLLDPEYLFVYPESGKIQLIVIPCQTIVNEGYTLSDCVDKMFERFSFNKNGENAKKLQNQLKKGVCTLRDLKELAELVRALESEDQVQEAAKEDFFTLPDEPESKQEPEELHIEELQIEEAPVEEPFAEEVPVEEVPDKNVQAEEILQEKTEEDAVAALFETLDLDQVSSHVKNIPDAPKTSRETAILEEIVKDAEASKRNDADLTNDMAFMKQQLREDMRRELEEELTDQIKEKLRRELENELREKLWKELSETYTQNMRQSIETELREKIQAEVEAENNQKKEVEETEERLPYLIRKKTGEIIQLTKQTFIIGKLDTCCDYVIRGNNAISRLHAVIKYKEDSDSYFIVDCNSTNHIYLNGRRIEAEQPVELKDGMHIHLALEEFIFQLT